MARYKNNEKKLQHKQKLRKEFAEFAGDVNLHNLLSQVGAAAGGITSTRLGLGASCHADVGEASACRQSAEYGVSKCFLFSPSTRGK